MNSQNISDYMNYKPEKQSDFSKFQVFAYPHNSVKVIAHIMKDIHIDYLPVLKSPSEKILVGFIEFNRIKKFC